MRFLKLGISCLLLGLTLVGNLAPAIAGCGLPAQLEFSPSTRATVPPDPTVYLFVRDHPSYKTKVVDKVTATANGVAVEVIQEELPATRRYRVFSLKAKAAAGTKIELTVQAGETRTSVSYQVAKGAKPSTAQTTIKAATFESQKSDPSTHGFVLEVFPRAPFYRVEVDSKPVLVPDRSSEYRHAADTGVLLVGYFGCETFSVATDDPFRLRITPVFLDGSDGETYFPGCKFTKTENGGSGSCSNFYGASFGGPVKLN
jgi:hypothetical protein